jgi:hypothetical protein
MAIVDVITTVAHTGGLFLSTITAGGQQFLGSTGNFLIEFTKAVLNGLTK